MNIIPRIVLFIAATLCLSACEKAIINHGYVVNPEDFKKIVVGKDDAMSVYSTLGAPTIRSSVIAEDGTYSWYYVSKITEKTSFLDQVVVDQRTMIITFAKDGLVKSVSESTYESPVKSVTDTTETGGKTAGVLGETFGGMGKYMSRYTGKK